MIDLAFSFVVSYLQVLSFVSVLDRNVVGVQKEGQTIELIVRSCARHW